MSTQASRVSLADLSAAGIALRPAEAVAIAKELVLRVSRNVLPGVPSPHVVRFTAAGEILIEGPVAAGGGVERGARLLEAMLAGFDAPPELRASGALRLVLARAAGTLDIPAYVTLGDFAEALSRFAAPDPAAVVRDLYASWSAALRRAAAPEGAAGVAASGMDRTEITVSDLRRARRATGLTLAEIAERSRIPVSLLRELEWGYFVNWPPGQYGRTQLVRYARAAGLDDEVVLQTVEREFASVGRSLEAHADVAAPASSVDLVPVVHRPAIVAVARRRRSRRGSRWLAALAIPALVAIGFVPMAWNEWTAAHETPAAQAAPVAASVPPAAAQVPPDALAPAARAGERTDPLQSLTAPAPSRRRETGPSRAALPVNAAFSPAFATVGSAMFYHAKDTTGSALMRADTDGEGAVLRITRVVDDRAQNFHARPSPDGSQIAFDSDRDGERAVYIADANGGNVRRVTGEGFAAVPSWSPDGRVLAYVQAEPERPRTWNLWTVDLSSGDTRRITSHRVGQPWGAAWFPDGQRIAYSHEDRIIVRSIDGEQQKVYSSPRKGRMLRTPAVSPDGKRIMFQVYRDGAWLLDLPDGTMRKVLSDPTAEEFTWSPDGRQVAYHSRQTGKWGVWIMAAR